MIRKIFCALCAAAVLCFVTGASAEDLDALPDTEANEMLKAGLKAYTAGDYQEALNQYSDLLKAKPAHGRARLEKARTLYALEQYELAKDEFKFVLKTFDPPEPVRKKVKAYLKAIRRADSKFSVRGLITLGAFYDDNVNYGPEKETVELAPIDFGFTVVDELAVSEESQPQDSYGLLTMGTVQVGRDIGEHGDWSAFAAGHVYHTALEDHTEFETTLYGAAAGLRKESRNGVVDVPVRFQDLKRDGDTIMRSYGVAPTVMTLQEQGRISQQRVRVEYRDYEDADERDSWYVEAGQTFSFDRLEAIPFGLSTFLSGLGEFAEEDIYSNLGLRTGVSADKVLLKNLSMRLSLDYRGRWFDEKDTLDPERRKDHELLTAASLSMPLGYDIGATLLYQYTKNFSSVDLYDYERNFGMLSVHYDY